MRFQYGCEKYPTLNQLTIATLEKIPMTNEYEVPTISGIPDETIDLEKGYYHGLYVLLKFQKEFGVDKKE